MQKPFFPAASAWVLPSACPARGARCIWLAAVGPGRALAQPWSIPGPALAAGQFGGDTLEPLSLEKVPRDGARAATPSRAGAVHASQRASSGASMRRREGLGVAVAGTGAPAFSLSVRSVRGVPPCRRAAQSQPFAPGPGGAIVFVSQPRPREAPQESGGA